MNRTAISDPGSRPWFEGYLNAFNARDYDGFGAFYAQDVAFRGQAASLDGRDAVMNFYRDVHRRLDEHIDLLGYVGSPSLAAAEIRTTLVAREDWPDFPTGPLEKGDRRQSINFAFYDIGNGLFTRIRSARFARL
ncbi:hypothetical protein GCM10023208_14120 [Erythrobacter westpacificensis]|uniref:SnoaL-like domain-containing protein n=1 Tax=Erythrobacter westpacificensis TaxID=1055231 RepID=A0ABP9K7V8_9SPHN